MKLNMKFKPMLLILIALLVGSKFLLDMEMKAMKNAKSDLEMKRTSLTNAQTDIENIKSMLAPYQNGPKQVNHKLNDVLYRFIYDKNLLSNRYGIHFIALNLPQNLMGVGEGVGNLEGIKKMSLEISIDYKNYENMKMFLNALKKDYGMSVYDVIIKSDQVYLKAYVFGHD